MSVDTCEAVRAMSARRPSAKLVQADGSLNPRDNNVEPRLCLAKRLLLLADESFHVRYSLTHINVTVYLHFTNGDAENNVLPLGLSFRGKARSIVLRDARTRPTRTYSKRDRRHRSA